MVAAVAVDESGPAVVAAADDDDDVTRTAPSAVRDHSSPNPVSSKALAAQGRHVTHGDIIDPDANGSGKEEDLKEAAETEAAYHRPPDRGKYRDQELI